MKTIAAVTLAFLPGTFVAVSVTTNASLRNADKIHLVSFWHELLRLLSRGWPTSMDSLREIMDLLGRHSPSDCSYAGMLVGVGLWAKKMQNSKGLASSTPSKSNHAGRKARS